MRLRTILPAAALGVLSVAWTVRDARACGGCFHEPPQPNQSGTVVTDHRMIFTISPQQTTLYDEIEYSGSPGSFAWVLPIRSQVTVGLSSDVVFTALEQTTGTTIVAPILPQCPVSNCACGPLFNGAAGSGSGGGGSSSGVNVISQQTIGPYATVQLQSTDPNALNAWLTANGYVIPPDVQPIIAAYVNEQFDFLALKLAPGQGIQAMRPVRVTSPGAGLSLPLRMVAAGTGATVGITLWVIGDGSYEPQNFPFFTIAPSELTWDWSINRSNYTTVRAQKEAAANSAAWQIESSLALSPFSIQNIVLQGASDYTALPTGDGGSGQTAADARSADLGVLFPEGNLAMRVTRMRGDLSHAALASDLELQAAADQTVLSNVYQVTQSVNAPKCPVVPACTCSGGSSGFNGSGSGGSSGAIGSSGSGGAAGDGGVSSNAGSPTVRAGCAASASEPGNGAAGFVAAGFLGMALLRARRKRS
jgi:uncharacterized protein (TIGR03382 family)